MSETSEWVDQFLMVGNQPVLDLLNTALISDGAPVELLPDAAALVRWIKASGLARTALEDSALDRWETTKEAGALLQELIAFREMLRECVERLESGGTPSQTFLADLNQRLSDHPIRFKLQSSTNVIKREQAPGCTIADTVWAALLDATADLLTAQDTQRLRKCEGCVVHFRDVSKKGSRRWCSMNLCGNRVKVAAYQAKKRRERVA